MKKPRGNKTSKVARDDRRAQVIEHLKAAPSLKQREIAAEVGVSLATVKRDLAALAENFQTGNGPAFEEFKRAQLRVFELMEKSLLEGSIDTDVAREWRGIRSEISKLIGLNAESRAVIAHVTTESSPLFLKFKKASAGLSNEQLLESFDYLAALPRQKREAVRDASWFPPVEPKLLEGGEDETA